jgi:hypothetical protein
MTKTNGLRIRRMNIHGLKSHEVEAKGMMEVRGVTGQGTCYLMTMGFPSAGSDPRVTFVKRLTYHMRDREESNPLRFF